MDSPKNSKTFGLSIYIDSCEQMFKKFHKKIFILSITFKVDLYRQTLIDKVVTTLHLPY